MGLPSSSPDPNHSQNLPPFIEEELGAGLLSVCKLNTLRFCERRFYLECVEGHFNSNDHTEAGNDVHARVDEKKRRYLASESLGLCAILDEVDPKEGVPIEYKKGSPPNPYKYQTAWLNEAIQLCAQGMLLEEEIKTPISYGYLYYDEIKRRVKVEFDDTLRQQTQEAITQCHTILQLEQSPPPLVNSDKCSGCSVLDICRPDEINVANQKAYPGNTVMTKRCLVPRDDGAILYISKPGSGLRKELDTLVVTSPDGTKEPIGIHRLRQVWINQPTWLSSGALELCLFHQVPLLIHGKNGRYLGQLHGPWGKNVAIRRAQFKAFEAQGPCLELSQQLIRSKIRNQRVYVGRTIAKGSPGLEDDMQTLKRLEKNSLETESLGSLLGVEGAAAAFYFKWFSQMVKTPEFEFVKRKRRPATDPINALLNFGYSILTAECISALQANGLDPYFGFYHQSKYGRPALALDLMEPLRPVIVDSLILTLINKRQLDKRCFTWEGQRCVMTDTGRRTFFQAWSDRLDTPVTHPTFEYSLPYRRVISLEARMLAAFLLGEITEYRPFTWK